MPVAFFDQEPGEGLREHRIGLFRSLAQGLCGVMQEPVGESIREIIDDFVSRLTRCQESARLIDGLSTDCLGLIAQGADGRTCIVSARFAEKSGHLLIDQEFCAVRGHLALLAVLVDQLL